MANNTEDENNKINEFLFSKIQLIIVDLLVYISLLHIVQEAMTKVVSANPICQMNFSIIGLVANSI